MKRRLVGSLYGLLSLTAFLQAATFQDWQLASFTPEQLAIPATSGAIADPDADGLVNLHEYAFFGQPLVNEAALVPVLSQAVGHLVLTYRERHGLSDVSIRLQGSDSLANWITYNVVTEADRETLTGYDEVTLIDPEPFTQDRRFLRLQVKLLPIPEPRAPVQLSLSVVTSTSWSMAWTDPNTTETGYAVERLLPTHVWERLATRGADTGNWQHTAANYQTSITYRVVAIVADGREAASNPITLPDSDGDGIPDALELGASYAGAYGTYASKPDVYSSSGSGVSDGWLAANGFDPATHDTSLDTDGDGLSDAEEAARGTDPRSADTDGDGVPDSEDGWPRDAALKQAPLPEVRYAVIRLKNLGVTDDMHVDEIDDAGNVLAWTWTDSYSNYYGDQNHLYLWSASTHTATQVPFFYDSVGTIDFSAGEDQNNQDSMSVSMEWDNLSPDGRVLGAIINEHQRLQAASWTPAGGVEPYNTTSPINPDDLFSYSYITGGNRMGTYISLELGVGIDRDLNGRHYIAYYYRGGVLYTNGATAPGFLSGPVVATVPSDGVATLSQSSYFEPVRINDGGMIIGLLRGTTLTSQHGVNFQSTTAGAVFEANQLHSFGANIHPKTITSEANPIVLGYYSTGSSGLWRAVKTGNTWNEGPLSLWDGLAQSGSTFGYSDSYFTASNDRLEIVCESQIARNGMIHLLADLMPAGWTAIRARDINNHGVVLAEAFRTLDDQGLPISNLQSEPVLLVPYEVVSHDPSAVVSSAPQHTDIVGSSSPAPDVELHVENAEITPTGSLSITVSGRVSDGLSEVLANSAQRVATLRFKVDGEEVGTPVSLTYSPVSEPLRLARSSTTFLQTLVIPNPKPRGYIVVAETDSNAAGNTGWDKVAVGLDTEMIPFSTGSAENRISVVFNTAPSTSVVDQVIVYFGNRPATSGDAVLTETAANSSVYTGTLQVDGQPASCTLKIKPSIGFNSTQTDQLPLQMVYQVPGRPAVLTSGIWQETGVSTLHFLPDGYSFAGERLAVNLVDDLPGSTPASFEPLVFRTGLPASAAQVAGFEFKVNGQACTLKEFTYNGYTATYAVSSPSDTHPRIFVPSIAVLPSEIAISNAASDDDVINWAMTALGQQAVRTQVVAGPASFSSELLAAHIGTLPRWASTGPPSGSSAASTSASGWKAPGDTISELDLRTAYAFIYPDLFSAVLLKVYNAQGHHIELGDVLGDYDFETWWLNWDNKSIIQIENDDDDINPAIAAQYLWQGLNQAHSTDGNFRDAVQVELGRIPLTQEVQAVINQSYVTWHADVGKSAARVGVAAGELYLSGISIVNEGADWALMINEVSEGHYTALAAALPFISVGVIKTMRIESSVTHKLLQPALAAQTAIELQLLKKIENWAERLDAYGAIVRGGELKKTLATVMTGPGGAIKIGKQPELRRRMLSLSGLPRNPALTHAHHDLPYQFVKDFAEIGIDINDPAFGRWIKIEDHERWHKHTNPKYNEFWETWLDSFDDSLPTKQQVLEKLIEARNSYLPNP